MLRLRALAPAGSEPSQHLARIAHCRCAFGRREDILQLVRDLAPAAIFAYGLMFRHVGLGEASIEWLAIGRRCDASNALFWNLTGVRPDEIDASRRWSHPEDLNGWIRCQLLLEALQRDGCLAAGWGRAMSGNPKWYQLCQMWSEILATLERECPSWRDGEGAAPRTLALIDNIDNTLAAAAVEHRPAPAPPALMLAVGGPE